MLMGSIQRVSSVDGLNLINNETRDDSKRCEDIKIGRKAGYGGGALLYCDLTKDRRLGRARGTGRREIRNATGIVVIQNCGWSFPTFEFVITMAFLTD